MIDSHSPSSPPSLSSPPSSKSSPSPSSIMPCSSDRWSDLWRRIFSRDSTDRKLARLERQHLKLAKSARETLKDRQLALSYEIKAIAVFNQRIAIKEQEQRLLFMQASATHNTAKASKHLQAIKNMQTQYVSLPGPEAMEGLCSKLPPSPAFQNIQPFPSPPPPPSRPALPSSPLSPQSSKVGESVTYMASQSISSRDFPSSTLNSSPSSSERFYPPPYSNFPPSAPIALPVKLHVMLGQEF